ncbi:hypothetical protein MCHIJ_09420 [Mycolicibacterium chitae]|uniref:Uncharacterized protein n=1 Tax=Mycolicibacterium chitae TaxID=1792 RepID=A0A448ID58_MYCCI|nr:hypothetical protein [Mycolicibacterium chitae]MCV7109141.1 hypothetical protein [Mycolicibacterium chitae]BBZ01505.1 hypothetical protein MCHIJ_09420 [Mycolicibacterium chitae]VEG50341.1 Uncharacterised protein [Mycolicibacterium chitae]
MTGLVALTSGSAAETATFAEPRHRAHLDAVVYTGATGNSIDDAAAVWVPEGTPKRRLSRLAPQLEALLGRGGIVLMFGEQQGGWPRSLRWTFRPVGGAGKTRVGGAWLGTEVGAAAQALHHHGVLEAPDGAEILLAAPDGPAVAYLHRPTSGGTLMVSTIDPLAHYGHTRAPASARFLAAFLPWVTTTLLPGSLR